MQVLCISLQSAHERRSFQLLQAQQLGLGLSWIDAYTAQDVQEQAQNQDFESWERPLMPTELACFWSHQKAWQQVLQSNQPALILEDDACLSSHVPEFLQAIENKPSMDHVSLEVRWRSKWLGRTAEALTSSGLGISRLFQDRAGAAAYVLWPNAAQQLLMKAQQQGPALADAFIANYHEWNSFQAEPALAIQSDVASYHDVEVLLKTNSYIQASVNTRPKSTHSWSFAIKRLKAQLKLAWHKLASFPWAQLRMPKLDVAGFEWHQRPKP